MTHYRVEVKMENFGIASDVVTGLDETRTFINETVNSWRKYQVTQGKPIVVNIWNADRAYDPFSPDKVFNLVC